MTLLLERPNGLIMATPAQVVRSESELAQEIAANTAGWDVGEANPYLKWVAGNYVESDKPNSNKQLWTRADLEGAEHSIRYAPLNMVHKSREPIGFVHSTQSIEVDAAAETAPKRIQIQTLSGMWTHLFPFEAALVDAADEKGSLYLSMECRGTHLICAGDQGCGETFDYMRPAEHCEHLKERSSVRHIVNPTFRGSALIIPPIKPGWSSAHATVIEDEVLSEAALLAEQHEDAYRAANAEGQDLSASEWEALMAAIVGLGRVD